VPVLGGKNLSQHKLNGSLTSSRGEHALATRKPEANAGHPPGHLGSGDSFSLYRRLFLLISKNLAFLI